MGQVLAASLANLHGRCAAGGTLAPGCTSRERTTVGYCQPTVVVALSPNTAITYHAGNVRRFVMFDDNHVDNGLLAAPPPDDGTVPDYANPGLPLASLTTMIEAN